MPKQWEYRIIDQNDLEEEKESGGWLENLLNQLGDEGFRLVPIILKNPGDEGSEAKMLVMEREKKEEPEEVEIVGPAHNFPPD